MNKFIRQELCSRSAGDVCQLAVDYCIITDREHTELITAVQELALQDKNKVLVTIDHDTPNSTIEVGAKPRPLINWSVKEGLSGPAGRWYRHSRSRPRRCRCPGPHRDRCSPSGRPEDRYPDRYGTTGFDRSPRRRLGRQRHDAGCCPPFGTGS